MVFSDNMTILHINTNYINSALHQTMIEHLNMLGINSKVFVPTYNKKVSIVKTNDYVTVSECFKKWDRLFFYKKQGKIYSKILATYNVREIDCIHAYTLFTDGNVAMKLSKQFDIPYVVAVRNTDVNCFFKKLVFLRSKGIEILNNASAVFFLSPAYKQEVMMKYVPKRLQDEIEKKSYIIPNGIDDFWFKEICNDYRHKNFDVKRINCISVGNIDKNKNVGLTIEALKKMKKKGWDVSLKIIGKVVDKSLFADYSTHDFFQYLGIKTKEEIIEYLRDSDIFIMPSHTETFGLVYAEAMSQGLPVIYTKGQGFYGQFDEGKVGYAVNDNDPDSVVSAIIKIINDYDSISKNCISSVIKFDWNSIAKKYDSIYNTIKQTTFKVC